MQFLLSITNKLEGYRAFLRELREKARKNVFLCVFFTKYCQKAALSPVCGRLLRDD